MAPGCNLFRTEIFFSLKHRLWILNKGVLMFVPNVHKSKNKKNDLNPCLSVLILRERLRTHKLCKIFKIKIVILHLLP